MTEYIKREDALKMCSGEIQNIRYMTDVFGKKYECCVGARRISADEIAEQIKKIPSADVVERKKGKWGDNTKDESWKCSECGFIFYSVGFYKIYNTKFGMRFCPNCGADMRHSDD